MVSFFGAMLGSGMFLFRVRCKLDEMKWLTVELRSALPADGSIKISPMGPKKSEIVRKSLLKKAFAASVLDRVTCRDGRSVKEWNCSSNSDAERVSEKLVFDSVIDQFSSISVLTF